MFKLLLLYLAAIVSFWIDYWLGAHYHDYALQLLFSPVLFASVMWAGLETLDRHDKSKEK